MVGGTEIRERTGQLIKFQGMPSMVIFCQQKFTFSMFHNLPKQLELNLKEKSMGDISHLNHRRCDKLVENEL